jgi:hypothetical protein
MARCRRCGRHGLAEGPAGPGSTALSPDEGGGGLAPAQPLPAAAPARRHHHEPLRLGRRLDVRGQLWALAAGHPSKDVREHAIDAAQALGDSLAASSGLVQSMHETLDEDAVTQARELAEQWHRTAADRLEHLLEAIQQA